MQQSRAVLVTGDMHHKVWDTVFECYTKSFADDSESSLFLFPVAPHVRRYITPIGVGAYAES
jgi:hypothetical protein